MARILTLMTALPVPVKRGLGFGGWLLVSFLIVAMGFAGYVLLHGPK